MGRIWEIRTWIWQVVRTEKSKDHRRNEDTQGGADTAAVFFAFDFLCIFRSRARRQRRARHLLTFIALSSEDDAPETRGPLVTFLFFLLSSLAFVAVTS